MVVRERERQGKQSRSEVGFIRLEADQSEGLTIDTGCQHQAGGPVHNATSFMFVSQSRSSVRCIPVRTQ